MDGWMEGGRDRSMGGRREGGRGGGGVDGLMDEWREVWMDGMISRTYISLLLRLACCSMHKHVQRFWSVWKVYGNYSEAQWWAYTMADRSTIFVEDQVWPIVLYVTHIPWRHFICSGVVCLSICPPFCLFVCMSVCLCVCLFLSTCLFVSLEPLRKPLLT